MDSIASSIKDLIITYHEVNSSTIDELDEEPSPLEFMRYVAKNRPFVIRKGAADWHACRDWNTEFLRREIGDSMVQVAITPFG
jgi:jumonji domain-containing protein 7